MSTKPTEYKINFASVNLVNVVNLKNNLNPTKVGQPSSKQILNNCPEYENIYSLDVIKQKEITLLYRDLFKIKSEIETEDSQRAPSTAGMVLVNDDNLRISIVHQSPGKYK